MYAWVYAKNIKQPLSNQTFFDTERLKQKVIGRSAQERVIAADTVRET